MRNQSLPVHRLLAERRQCPWHRDEHAFESHWLRDMPGAPKADSGAVGEPRPSDVADAAVQAGPQTTTPRASPPARPEPMSGQVVARLRAEGKTQQAIADALGVDQRTVDRDLAEFNDVVKLTGSDGRAEQGKTQQAIADALGVSYGTVVNDLQFVNIDKLAGSDGQGLTR